MSNVFQGIFGGSKSKQTSDSHNQAYPDISNTFGGVAKQSGQATDFISNLLGLGGNGAAQGAFDNYKDSSGYKFMLDSGSKAITDNAATKGMLSSGATGKALQDYGENVGSGYFNNYLDKLMGLSGQGLQAGGLISNAGQVSSSTGTSSNKPGLGGFLGSLAGGIAKSDRAAKTNIVYLGKLDSGLPVYSFQYKEDKTRHVGVMADEVARIQPEALGPMIDGYATVDYSKIEGWTD